MRTGLAGNSTSFNQPSVIHNNGNTTQLFYDASHQRWKQIATYGSSTETTIYIGGLMEKTTTSTGTDYKHYIPVGDTTVEYIRRSSGTNNTYYATSDHLGSSDMVTCGSDVSGCAAGTVLVHESFSAFGTRRGSSWTGLPTTTDMNNIASTTRIGFTGQEMMDNLGLVNMNGRVYDPSIGRFISADPHVTDPDNTQNYSRYSYVLNNPLRYTDPTGFDVSGQQPNCTNPYGNSWDGNAPGPNKTLPNEGNTGGDQSGCQPNSADENLCHDPTGSPMPCPATATGPSSNSGTPMLASKAGDFLRKNIPLVGGILGGLNRPGFDGGFNS